ISAVDGKTRADFNRVQNKKDEYVFAYDVDKDNPQSPSMAFRAGANFKLIAAIEYSNGKWTKIPPSRAAPLFAQQIDQWVRTVDANGGASSASLPRSKLGRSSAPLPKFVSAALAGARPLALAHCFEPCTRTFLTPAATSGCLVMAR